MQIAWTALITALLLSNVTVRAAEPVSPTSQSSSEIETLIQHLSADDFRQREEAQAQLVQLGDSVRGRLERLVTESADQETRSRAEAALVQIDENASHGPSLITMHFT